MHLSKSRMLVLGTSVIGLGIICGTFLWLKLAPKSVHRSSEVQPLEGLGRYGAVPEFSLVERGGKNVTRADMRGKVWIADFIYTNCEDTCPIQSAAMAKLQARFGNHHELRLVSFSVDPERDTPLALARYAERFKADAAGWLFLTGDKEEIARLVQLGFRLSAAALTDGDSKETVIIHSPRFVLVDKNSEIRGYYDSRDGTALERLSKDVTTLINNKRSG